MKIIIVGGGKIGATLIESLESEGHDITVIDNDQRVIDEISNIYDVMCVCGNGVDNETLNESEVSKAELLIAVTNSDEINMLICFIAKKMGVAYTVARVRNPEFNDKRMGQVKQYLDLSLTINPEFLAALEIFNILKLPAAINIETFSRRNFSMIELLLKEGTHLDGMSLIELRKKYNLNFLISVVKRGNEVYIPDGNFVLKTGDHICLTANFIEIQKLLKMLGLAKKQSKSVMILGATTTCYYLAKMLIRSGTDVTIIDKDIDRCNQFAEKLPEAVIINGDGAEQEVLMEEGIASTDAFVSLTGMDEENILISFFAQSQNVPRVIAKVNRNELAAMAEKLGLDSVVSPKKAVSNVVTSYARALENSLGSNVETMYKLMDGSVEALEFNVQTDFKAQHIPLKEMKLKKDVLIAGIIRKRKAFVPTGNDEIVAGDKIVIIAKSSDQKMNDLADILR
ncbi:MAG: Trk system potassium transporter TrkA [Ruminococcaceae bacterium]|nr:Trk system potassium transporter TrkA [Oscillospiraceae bacterium]